MFKHSLLAVTSVVLLSLISACSGQSDTKEKQAEIVLTENAIPCSEPRPQVCTMIYLPVCAISTSGAQTIEASDCSACAKADVIAYTQGDCSAASDPSTAPSTDSAPESDEPSSDSEAPQPSS